MHFGKPVLTCVAANQHPVAWERTMSSPFLSVVFFVIVIVIGVWLMRVGNKPRK